MPANLGLRSPDVNGPSPSSPIDANDIFVHFCQLAALVITIYDHLITLDTEVEYVWSKRWSKSKGLFIMARYIGDILIISVCVVFFNNNASYLFCAIGVKLVASGFIIIIIITQMIMLLRIKAMYGKVISILIAALWITEVITILCLGIASLVAIDVDPVTMDRAQMCSPTYLPRYAFLFWVPIMVFETFLFSLALRIAYRNYLEIGTWRGASLLYIVLRDNFIFFVCAFAAYLVTATTWLDAKPEYFVVPVSFTCSLTTVLGCRLILNLCEAYHHPRDPDVTPPLSIWAATTTGNIQFRTMRRASKSVTSGWPRWRRPQSQLGELTTDYILSPARASIGRLPSGTTNEAWSNEPGEGFELEEIGHLATPVMKKLDDKKASEDS